MIAVEGMDLPANVGLDWSFPNCWTLGLLLRMETQDTDAEIVHQVAHRYGSIACYEGIAPEKLRVKTRTNTDSDFGQWPKIQDVDEDELGVQPRYV